jgi:hypothetical protein
MKEYLDGEGSKDIVRLYSGFGISRQKEVLPYNIELTTLLAALLDTMVKFNLKSLNERDSNLKPVMLNIYKEIKKILKLMKV